MSNVDRFPGRHPLCTCPDKKLASGLQVLEAQPDCPGASIAHRTLDLAECQQLIASFHERHAVTQPTEHQLLIWSDAQARTDEGRPLPGDDQLIADHECYLQGAQKDFDDQLAARRAEDLCPMTPEATA
jgi:hypothetical protein